MSTGKQASLCESKKESRSHQALKIVDQAHSGHAYAPQQHNERDELAGTESLEEDIGERLGKRVGNEEEGEGGIVLTPGDVQAVLKTVESGISDIGPVEETDQVEKT